MKSAGEWLRQTQLGDAEYPPVPGITLALRQKAKATIDQAGVTFWIIFLGALLQLQEGGFFNEFLGVDLFSKSGQRRILRRG
jgi:hypothetical protein